MIEKSITNFIDRVAGPAASEIGQMLQDNVRVYRLKNQLRLIEKAKKYLEEAGVTPRPVPFRTLLPLLEKGSLEDDEALNDRWAALLANAADASYDGVITPSFPNIMEQLSPYEVKALDFLYSELHNKDLSFAVNFSRIEKSCDLTHENLCLAADNMSRVGLVIPGGEMGKNKYSLELRGYFVLGMTALGKAFVKSCTRSNGT